ncbi:hypothetical protein RSOLAG22IIIB_04995 [Rhizoctonia solani]|uniref:Uncharacterized protein n=1 Tax=Rhizoctonia solani TaxID=456999 RepID=A0A0K6G2R2_9AGAM|nr:hypothetical protein RSOLAG22IIIB_04995 [Rhizoctonia solani]
MSHPGRVSNRRNYVPLRRQNRNNGRGNLVGFFMHHTNVTAQTAQLHAETQREQLLLDREREHARPPPPIYFEPRAHETIPRMEPQILQFLGKWLHPLLGWVKSTNEASPPTSDGTQNGPGFTRPAEDLTLESDPTFTRVIDILDPALIHILDRTEEVTGRLEDAHKAIVRIIDLMKDSDYLTCNIHTQLKASGTIILNPIQGSSTGPAPAVPSDPKPTQPGYSQPSMRLDVAS